MRGEGEGEGEGLRTTSSPLGLDIASSSLGSSITSTFSSSRDAEMKPTRPSLSIRTRDHSGFVPFSRKMHVSPTAAVSEPGFLALAA